VVVHELQGLQDRPKVVALGGGAVQSDDVRAALARTAHVIWLTAPAETLWRRASSEGGRPLARDEEAFRELLESRAELYRAVAGDIADTSSGAAEEVAEVVMARLGARPRQAAPQPAHGEGAA